MLKLNLEGITFELIIDRYTPGSTDYDWCLVTLHLSAKDWLNYRLDKDESLTSNEVDELTDSLNLLLNGENKATELAFIEPFFKIEFYPGNDSILNWKVAFFDGGALTCNELTLAFDREDIEKLYQYLKEVQNGSC